MAYVAKLYGPPLDEQTARPPDQVRYLAGLHPLEALGSRLRRQAAQVGWDETEQQIAMSDGGGGPVGRLSGMTTQTNGQSYLQI